MADQTVAPGQTVELKDGRIALVRFFGSTLFAEGNWVGVELDDASGKNDGSVKGVRYFDCADGCGMFLRITGISRVVDEPARAPDDVLDEEEEEMGEGDVGGEGLEEGEGGELLDEGAEEDLDDDRGGLESPVPVAAAAAVPRASMAGARQAVRPSSLNTLGTTAKAASDPAVGRRMSLNAPGQSPVSRAARSGIRSPSKPPPVPSLPTSRTTTPSNSRPSAAAAAPRSRPSLGGSSSRGSMPPPPAPSAAKPRQPSVSSTSGARPPPAAARTSASRLSISTTKPGLPGRGALGASRRSASDVAGMTRQPAAAAPSEALGSPSEDAVISPQPHSPMVPRASALERMAAAAASSSSSRAGGAAAASAMRTSVGPAPSAASATAGSISGDTERLTTKAQTLERQNAEQRDKIKELEKSKVERDRFEGIIHKLQQKYQPLQQENTELKKMLDEAEKRLESVEQMQADLEDEYRDQLELATVEREMAEVQAENYKLELDTVKVKADELELEAELLREENGELSKGMTMEEKESTGWMQMQKHNERLKEALLKLHDLSRDNEAELRQQIAALEEDVRDYAAVRDEHAATVEALHKAEAVTEDLRQQLDVAIGAEDMIEDLSERNGALQEELRERNAIIHDLESLREINDDLEHNYIQNAREMQEELDLKESVIGEQARRAARQEEALIDMANTLARFREMVANQQAELDASHATSAEAATESERLRDRSRAVEDLNKKLRDTVTNAQNKTIELELRRLDVQVAQRELEIVRRFLPDTYADSERDSVAVLLSFRRIAFKAGMLRDLMRKRIAEQQRRREQQQREASSSSGGPPDADDDGGEDAVFDGCDAVDNLATIAVLGDRLTNAAGHCSVDEFARYRRALESVEPVNRNLDRLVDALRKDELREKTCAADARRLVDVVAHLVVDCIEGGVGGGGGENEADGGGAEDPRRQGKSGGAGEEDAKREIEGQLASSADEAVARTAVMHCQLDSAALCLDTMRSMVERVLRGGGGGGEEQQQQQEGREPAVVAAAAPLDEGGEDGDEGVASTATPSGYAPAPTTHNDDPEERRLGAQFASRVEAASYQTRVAKVAVGKVARALEEYQQRSLGLRRDVDARGRLGAAAAMTAELAAAAREAGLALHQVLHGGEPGRTRPRSHAEMQAHVDFLTTYTATAAELTAEAARLAEACAELANYHEFSRGVAPWELRSQQARLLQLVPEKTEQELRQARDALREAQKRAREEKEASEIAALRIAHLQSRMADEKEVARQMDEFKAQIASMTTQNAGLKEDRMKQDKELQALEADRDKWQKIAGDSRAFADGMDAADLRAGQERAAAAAAHMDALKDEILGLESAVRHLREDNRRARTTEQAAYDWLSEPRSGGGAAGGGTTTATRESSSRKRRRGAVAAESRNALAELVRIATAPGVGVVSLAAAFGAAPSAGDGRDEQEAAEVDRLAWRPARVAPRHVVARRAEEYAAWMDWRAGVLKKGDALARDSAARGLQRVAGREAVARLQIRLPGGAAGGDKGVRTGGGVSVVGSAEWEALQGRVVV